MAVYNFNTYKEFLKNFISENGSRGVISQIAQVCGCDRTYISQVLNGKAEMTPDHMVQFCENFSFSESETNFLMTLLLKDRSSSLKTRKLLEAKLKKMKSDALAVTNKVYNAHSPKQISEEMRTLYYSNWSYGAIHILTSIPEFQSVSSLAHKLQMSVAAVSQVLKDLIEMGLIKNENGRYTHIGGDIYLTRQSPQIFSQHLNWRLKAVERSYEKEDVHYSLAFSVSEKDVEKLREQIVELIELQRKTVQKSGAEAACVFCVDFFKI